jgi:hypothetical protein
MKQLRLSSTCIMKAVCGNLEDPIREALKLAGFDLMRAVICQDDPINRQTIFAQPEKDEPYEGAGLQ